MKFLTEALKLMELEGDPRNIAKKLADELRRGAASFLQDDKDTFTGRDVRSWIRDSVNNIDREELYQDFPHFDSFGKHSDEIADALNRGDFTVHPVREGFRKPFARGTRGNNVVVGVKRPMGDDSAEDDAERERFDAEGDDWEIPGARDLANFGRRGNEEEEEYVRSPSDEEYNKAAAAIKRENPALVMGGIGVDKKTGDINIEATLRSGEHTASEHFILRSDGRLELTNEGAVKSVLKEMGFGHGFEQDEEDPNDRHSRHMKAYDDHSHRAHGALDKHRPGRQVHGIDDDPEKDEFNFYDDKGDDWSLDADDNISPRDMGGEEEEGIDALDKLQKNAGAIDSDWSKDMDDDVSPRDRIGAEEEEGEQIDVPCPDCGGKGSFRDRDGNREDCDECRGSGRVNVPKYSNDRENEEYTMEGRERLQHLAGIITEGKKPAFLKGKDGDDKDSDDKDDGKKSKKPAFLNGGDGDDKDSDDKDDKKKSKKKDSNDDSDDDSDDKDDKKKKKTDEGLERLRHLGGVVNEAKAKKDYDGDGKVESSEAEHKGVVDKAIKAKKK